MVMECKIVEAKAKLRTSETKGYNNERAFAFMTF